MTRPLPPLLLVVAVLPAWGRWWSKYTAVHVLGQNGFRLYTLLGRVSFSANGIPCASEFDTGMLVELLRCNLLDVSSVVFQTLARRSRAHVHGGHSGLFLDTIGRFGALQDGCCSVW